MRPRQLHGGRSSIPWAAYGGFVAGCSRAGLWRYRSGPAVGPVGASQGCRGFERHPGAADLASKRERRSAGLAELSAPGHMGYHLAFHALTGRRSADIYLGDHLICEIKQRRRHLVDYSPTYRRRQMVHLRVRNGVVLDADDAATPTPSRRVDEAPRSPTPQVEGALGCLAGDPPHHRGSSHDHKG